MMKAAERVAIAGLCCLMASQALAQTTRSRLAPASVAREYHPLEAGKTSREIRVADDEKWSYFVYAPNSYNAERKWPVMFVMSPGGGSAGVLTRYIPGAELNNWLLVVSVQARNDFKDGQKAVTAMVADVLKRFPVDDERLYSSGMSGGSRRAAALARDHKGKPFAGVLACGAGAPLDEIPSKTAAFGLCGSNCFNRWDMACSFVNIKNKNCALRFFIGNHNWANAEDITYAMTWLNAAGLGKAPQANKARVAERSTLANAIRAEVERCKATEPEKAYDWACCLTLVTPGTGSLPVKEMQELMRNPKVKMYAEGLQAMDGFVKKHFATSMMDFENRNGTPAAKKDAERLAEKYKDTGLAELFVRMGEPSVKP
jgi:hypothetical protein